MRIIPSTLTAAQGGAQLVPIVSLELRRRRYGLLLPAWRIAYAGEDPAGPHDGAFAADGGLVRARYDGSGRLCLARQEELGSAPAWAEGPPAGPLRPAVVPDPQGEAVYVLYAAPGCQILRCIPSPDGGRSWGTPEDVFDETSAQISGVAGAMRCRGGRDLLAFYSVDGGGAGSDDVLRVIGRPLGGAWGAPATWSCGPRYSFAGLDAGWEDDFCLLLACREADPPYAPCLWTLLYGDGFALPAGAWSTPEVLERSDDPLISFEEPSLCLSDVPRLSFVYQDVRSGAGRRTILRVHLPGQVFVDPLWSEGQPFPDAPPAGCGPRLRGRRDDPPLVLIGHNRLWAGELSTAAQELGERCLSYRYEEGPASIWLTVTLDNSDGGLSTPEIGSEMLLRRGLRLTGGDALAPLPAVNLERMSWRDAGGAATLTLAGAGPHHVLRAWRAGRLLAWPAGSRTLGSMAAALLARAGLAFATPVSGGSPLVGVMKPAFAILPGSDGLTALEALLSRAGDVALFDGVSALLHKTLAPDQPAVYGIGGAGEHPLLESEIVRARDEAAPAVNLVEVFGAGDVIGSAIDYVECMRAGPRRRTVRDEAYLDAGHAAARAAAELERARVAATGSWVRLRPIHGLELWDVLAVSRPRQWTGPRRFRVIELTERSDRRAHLHEQRLSLAPLPHDEEE